VGCRNGPDDRTGQRRSGRDEAEKNIPGRISSSFSSSRLLLSFSDEDDERVGGLSHVFDPIKESHEILPFESF
jgi:hypothetical protein